MGDAALPDRPLSLIEAVEAARPVVDGEDRRAHLIGFVGFEDERPEFLDGRLQRFVLPRLDGDDGEPNDGRVRQWSLLYATPGGSIVHAIVRAGSSHVTLGETTGSNDPVIRQMWALNMGGRLLVDSDTAIQSLRGADPASAALLDAGASMVYASSVVAIDPYGEVFDMVYEFYLRAPGSDAPAGYDRYAQVRHDDGTLVDAADVKPVARGQQVTLVDERFAISPFVPSLNAAKDLGTTVSNATLRLEVEGLGDFTFRLSSPQREVTLIEGRVLGQPLTERRELGTLVPDSYLVEVTGTGQVSFRLVMTGLVGL